jgi:hypothetical protein
MKYLMTITLTALLMWSCQNSTSKEETTTTTNEHAHHQAEEKSNEEKKKSKSPKTTAMGNIGKNHVHIEYSSPSVRGRQIWGGLVAYGQVWSSGAHRATTVNFGKDVTIGGVHIASGKYGFFTIPGEQEWTVIINKNWDQHLADDYDQGQDVVRVQVQPEENEFTESLKYSVTSIDDANGEIRLEWEGLILVLKVQNN